MAAERGHTESESFRSYQTLNFGPYQKEHKKPFGLLTVLNDETLVGGRQVSLTFEEDALLLLLPVVGGLIIQTEDGEEIFVQAGEGNLSRSKKGGKIALCNPYEEELVNYLHLQFCCPLHNHSQPGVFCFQLDDNKNCFLELFPAICTNGFYLKAAIGKFEGRKEVVYPVSSGSNSVLLFVLEGAVEAENRLLESRDALAVWEAEQVEVEALSKSAIFLLVEMGPDK